MAAPELTPRRARRLFELLIRELRSAPIRAPSPSEGETTFTRSVLAPLLQSFLDEVGFPGLLLRGDGAASVTSAHLLGAPFYPDIAVEHYRAPALAVEVKLLRGANRQNSVATAVGQASLYKQRYPHVGMALFDVRDSVPTAEVAAADSFLGGVLGVPLIYRARLPGGACAPHPI